MLESPRTINIIFVKEFKNFTSTFNRKQKDDYILNVNKIIKDKFNSKFIIPNKVQTFLINYEIKKLLDKAIYIKNEKYNNIIYLNSNLSSSIIKNAMKFMIDEYDFINFEFSMIESKNLDDDIEDIDDLNIIKL